MTFPFRFPTSRTLPSCELIIPQIRKPCFVTESFYLTARRCLEIDSRGKMAAVGHHKKLRIISKTSVTDVSRLPRNGYESGFLGGRAGCKQRTEEQRRGAKVHHLAFGEL